MDQAGRYGRPEIVRRERNNFDFLRLVAALLVLLGHSFILTGHKGDDPLFRIFAPWFSQTIALAIFFIISGYLVTKSYIGNAAAYPGNRLLRIFPALLVNILFITFICGPLLTNLATGEYFTLAQTYKYLLNIFILPYADTLPGVFSHNLDHNVNSSLWTLGHELILYIWVMLIGISRVRFRLAVPLILVLLVLLKLRGIDFFGLGGQGLQVPILPYVDLAIFFWLGSLCYLYADKIRYNYLILLALSAACATCYYFNIRIFPVYILLTYAVLYFAFAPGIKLHAAARYGDFSYGIYIYGWLVQQVIIQFSYGQVGAWKLFALSAFVSLFCGILSWHLVEKHALKYRAKALPAKV